MILRLAAQVQLHASKQFAVLGRVRGQQRRVIRGHLLQPALQPGPGRSPFAPHEQPDHQQDPLGILDLQATLLGDHARHRLGGGVRRERDHPGHRSKIGAVIVVSSVTDPAGGVRFHLQILGQHRDIAFRGPIVRSIVQIEG